MRSEAKSAFGGRKFLGILCLISFLAIGLGFSQSAQGEKEPIPEPYVQLFGNQWVDYCRPLLLKSFDELDAKVYLFIRRDINGKGGLVEVLFLKKGSTGRILGGWIKPYSSEEQGFVKLENGKWFLSEQKKERCEELEKREYYNEEGDPILEFYLKKSGEIIRIINIKKFVEENFEDQKTK